MVFVWLSISVVFPSFMSSFIDAVASMSGFPLDWPFVIIEVISVGMAMQKVRR